MVVNTLAIVQARMGSTRLPGKVLKKVGRKTLIEILLHRLSQSRKIDKIILATGENKVNAILAETVEKLDFEVSRGSDDDVLDRYYRTAKHYRPETVVRITGDCPLLDPVLVDEIIESFQKNTVDYASNTNPPSYPDGLDTEVFSFMALKIAHEQATKPFDREHVTSFIRTNGQFKCLNYANETDLSEERWTVDELEDFDVVRNVINHFTPNMDFSWKDVLNLKKTHPDYFEANKSIKRNAGAELGTGQKLYKRAKKIIPGGNMLLSKRPEMFLPEKWPAYFSKAKGCDVWDLDGNKYIDMSLMGIGTNILGFANKEIGDVIHDAIDQGNMSTLNCPEEVYLAERLVELHPWADMVRLARTGGEANAIAIRIARAATGKDKVAICGYHGWQDWYLATNLGGDAALDGHLLPGLEPIGVPRVLKDTTLAFNYNDISSLHTLLNEHDIGIIMMEVSRSFEPAPGFLESIRNIATAKNIILIFDECSSGFRETFGGLHKKFNVEPDMAVFGKALGNGYPITAVIGKRNIMEAAQMTFISSTFWTERLGPVAALKTLEIMERDKTWDYITLTGQVIIKGWFELAKKYNLELETIGLASMSSFIIPSDKWLYYKTYITQEMLKNGILASNSVYVCIEHKKNLLDRYFECLEPIFSTIEKCEAGKDIKELLNGPICHSGFKRLN